MSDIDTTPKVVAERNGLRLVHKQRDQVRWQNYSDVTLEQRQVDAMGFERWIYLESWMLCSSSVLRSENYVTLALKLLLDDGPVLEGGR